MIILYFTIRIKVNNTDCTFCKIRNDYYIVYNANYGLGKRYDKWDYKNGRGEWRFEGTINGTAKVNKVKVGKNW